MDLERTSQSAAAVRSRFTDDARVDDGNFSRHRETLPEGLRKRGAEIFSLYTASDVLDGIGQAEDDGLSHAFPQPLEKTHRSQP